MPQQPAAASPSARGSCACCARPPRETDSPARATCTAQSRRRRGLVALAGRPLAVPQAAGRLLAWPCAAEHEFGLTCACCCACRRHLVCVSQDTWAAVLAAHGELKRVPGFAKLKAEDQQRVRGRRKARAARIARAARMVWACSTLRVSTLPCRRRCWRHAARSRPARSCRNPCPSSRIRRTATPSAAWRPPRTARGRTSAVSALPQHCAAHSPHA